MLAIYKKELHAYFTSMVGWLYLAFFFLGVGLFHWVYNLLEGMGNFAYALSNVTILFVLIIPIFTMRIMAEEGKQKTDQLLYTAPVSIVKIVLGKYFAMITIFAIGLAVVSLYPLGMKQYGSMNLKMEYIAILGFLLLGCVYMSVGMFLSSITDSQILAAILTVLAFLFTFYASGIGSLLPTGNLSALLILSAMWLIVAIVAYVLMKHVLVAAVTFLLGEAALVLIYLLKPTLYDGILVKVFSCFSITEHYNNFVNGILSVTDVVYFVSVTGMFLFFTVQVINKKRWS